MIAEVRLNDTLRYGVQCFFETAGIDGIADSGRGGFGLDGFVEASPRAGRRYARPAGGAEVVGVARMKGDSHTALP